MAEVTITLEDTTDHVRLAVVYRDGMPADDADLTPAEVLAMCALETIADALNLPKGELND